MGRRELTREYQTTTGPQPPAPPAPGPIRSVRVISTGWAEAHREHVRGTRKPAYWWIFMGRDWVRLPINAFVIEHARGLVLFDTGQDSSVMSDPDYWPDPVTGFFMRHIFRFRMDRGDVLGRQLAGIGYDAARVKTAVISHLHADHVGGIRDIPQAELVVSEEAWEHMLGPHAERKMVLRRDIDVPGARWRRVRLPPTDDPALAPFTRALDLMGDGSLVLLPTPGHLPGSLSMLLRSAGAPPLLLVADLCYEADMLLEDRLPGTGDRAVLRESYARVRALAERMPDLVILPSHDPGAAAAVRWAYPRA